MSESNYLLENRQKETILSTSRALGEVTGEISEALTPAGLNPQIRPLITEALQALAEERREGPNGTLIVKAQRQDISKGQAL